MPGRWLEENVLEAGLELLDLLFPLPVLSAQRTLLPGNELPDVEHYRLKKLQIWILLNQNGEIS